MTSAIGIWLLPVIQRIFKVHFSDLVDILVSIDIFAGVLLDEALTFYYRFPGIDKFYHFYATAQIALAGFLIARHFLLKHKTAKTIALSLVFAFFFAVAVEASRIMYKRIKELIAAGETFAMETTLATRSGANLIREAQREGYYVTLLYFWLNTPDLAVERVKMRVAAGGHNIPESTIRRRYEAGIHNLFELYIPICDYWMIADNSMSPMEIIAKGFRNDKKEIYNSNVYSKLEHHE